MAVSGHTSVVAVYSGFVHILSTLTQRQLIGLQMHTTLHPDAPHTNMHADTRIC